MTKGAHLAPSHVWENLQSSKRGKGEVFAKLARCVPRRVRVRSALGRKSRKMQLYTCAYMVYISSDERDLDWQWSIAIRISFILLCDFISRGSNLFSFGCKGITGNQSSGGCGEDHS